mmetsp:Transcript_19025/g.72695  ORF Transcript_19025/g.72695 Transcript_19025/m.72695 type:complete len:416 (-) Transcript_19025:367-1614(-)
MPPPSPSSSLTRGRRAALGFLAVLVPRSALSSRPPNASISSRSDSSGMPPSAALHITPLATAGELGSTPSAAQHAAPDGGSTPLPQTSGCAEAGCSPGGPMFPARGQLSRTGAAAKASAPGRACVACDVPSRVESVRIPRCCPASAFPGALANSSLPGFLLMADALQHALVSCIACAASPESVTTRNEALSANAGWAGVLPPSSGGRHLESVLAGSGHQTDGIRGTTTSPDSSVIIPTEDTPGDAPAGQRPPPRSVSRTPAGWSTSSHAEAWRHVAGREGPARSSAPIGGGRAVGASPCWPASATRASSVVNALLAQWRTNAASNGAGFLRARPLPWPARELNTRTTRGGAAPTPLPDASPGLPLSTAKPTQGRREHSTGSRPDPALTHAVARDVGQSGSLATWAAAAPAGPSGM